MGVGTPLGPCRGVLVMRAAQVKKACEKHPTRLHVGGLPAGAHKGRWPLPCRSTTPLLPALQIHNPLQKARSAAMAYPQFMDVINLMEAIKRLPPPDQRRRRPVGEAAA